MRTFGCALPLMILLGCGTVTTPASLVSAESTGWAPYATPIVHPDVMANSPAIETSLATIAPMFEPPVPNVVCGTSLTPVSGFLDVGLFDVTDGVVSRDAGAYSFSVTVGSPDTGC